MISYLREYWTGFHPVLLTRLEDESGSRIQEQRTSKEQEPRSSKEQEGLRRKQEERRRTENRKQDRMTAAGDLFLDQHRIFINEDEIDTAFAVDSIIR